MTSPKKGNNDDVINNEKKTPATSTSAKATMAPFTETIKAEISDTLKSPTLQKPQPPSSFPSHISSTAPSLSTSQQPITNKPIAKVVHFSPKIIQVDKPVFTDKPTTRVSRNVNKNAKKGGGMFVPPTPPPIKKPSLMGPFKDTPTQLTRVPRDQNIPLVVYNPPKMKPQSMGPSQIHKQPTVLPVVPMTTVGSGNIIIARPLFAPNGPTHLHTPPTLISSSQLKKLTSKTQHRSSTAGSNNKPPKRSSSSSSSGSIVESPTIPLAPYPCFTVHPPQLPKSSQLHPSAGAHHNENKPIIKTEPIDYSSSNNSSTTPTTTTSNNDNNNNIYNDNGHDLKPLAGDFRQWSVDEVYQHFYKSDCSKYADIFKDQVS